MGIKALSKIQIGAESSTAHGTAVAATTYWRGSGMLDDLRETVFPKEDVGLLGGTDRAYTPKLYGELSFDTIEATFEQFPLILEAGILEIGTGVADGAGSGKIYNYTYPTTAQAAIRSNTIECGDDVQEEEMEYCTVKDFTLSGKEREAWMIQANWFGRQVAPSTFTGSLSIPSVEEMLFGKTKLYIDVSSDAFGTTLKSSTLLEASLKFTTGWVPVWTANGAQYFDFVKCIGPEVLLDITFEHDATAVVEKAAWRAHTPRNIQLKIEGSALTSAGTAYSVKTALINVAGKWEKFDKIGENNGNNIVKGTLRGRYNVTNSKFGNILVVNEVSTL